MAVSRVASVAAVALLLGVLPSAAGAPGQFLQRRASVAARGAKRAIRVVTDMGNDDMGAFAVLQAVGLEPAAALATKGMMSPQDWAGDFAALLDSWNLSTGVHNGTDSCFDGRTCVPTDFIEEAWGYRASLRARFPFVLGPVAGPPSTLPGELFWQSSGCESKYTLLSLGPLSDIATALRGNAAAIECVGEIVQSGSFFASSPEGRALPLADQATLGALIGHPPELNDTSNISLDERVELNIGADAWALQEVLRLGVPLRIIPVEIASQYRFGRQRIEDDWADYSLELQEHFSNGAARELCELALGLEASTMLGTMACVHRAGTGDMATLDFDAIAATYLWAPERFSFSRRLVRVDPATGVTQACAGPSPECAEAEVATHFNATTWLDMLKTALRLHVHRGLNCYSLGDEDHGAESPVGLADSANDPYLTGSEAGAVVASCEEACARVEHCSGFVIGEVPAGLSCYLRSNIRPSMCDASDEHVTYVLRPRMSAEWSKHEGLNCYSTGEDRHGAESPPQLLDALNDPYLRRPGEAFALATCAQACVGVTGCSGFVLGAADDSFGCYLRSNLRLEECERDASNNFTTYILN